MTNTAKRELLAATRPRYRRANRAEKTRILAEFVANTGYHPKYAIRVLGQPLPPRTHTPRKPHLTYGPAVVRALVQLWELSGRLCSDRLHAFLPVWIQALETHGELVLPPEVKALLLSMSRATIDRKLRSTRRNLNHHGRSTTKPGSLLKHQIPIRTFADWDDHRPGFTEVDLVAHCGETTRGEFLHSLTLVDVATGWSECRAVTFRSQRDVFAALQFLRGRLPFPLLGIDSDNDGAFINAHLLRYTHLEHTPALAAGASVTFTRCRPYNKNDQAHIEQKNWSVVRRTIGYDRYEGPAATQALNAVYDLLRLWVNFFQPSMKLRSKERHGAKVRRRYDPAKTPFHRALEAPDVSPVVKQQLRDTYAKLNPVAIQQGLDQRLTAFWTYALGNNRA